MGYRARVQSKRVIEYGDISYCNNNSEPLLEWFRECYVICNVLENGSFEEWEIYRDKLHAIKEKDYDRLPAHLRDEVKELVSELIESNGNSDWVYLSWW